MRKKENTQKKPAAIDKLLEMVKTTDTRYWNDSCSMAELKYSISRGATGATTNPVIVNTVLTKEFALYKSTLTKVIRDNPTAVEDDISWLIIEHMAKAGAKLLEKKFDPEKGEGRLSIQTNTKYYQNSDLLTKQAIHFHGLGKNMQVKLPVTSAGIKAIEEVTYAGVSINATVCFTVPQAIAVAEAVERALHRRKQEGKNNALINPVCTIMVGRLDDWLKVVCDRDGIVVDPECLEWAGVAAVKRAYQIYNEKNFKTRLLSAAYRNHYHWSEFIGGSIIETIPYGWQVKFNKSRIEVKERMENPVDPVILKQLSSIRDFKKAYEPAGMQVSQFNSYGAVARTLLQFAQGYDSLVSFVRSHMIEVK